MYLTQFFTVAAVHLFAVMSPGPDFAMVIRNSVIYSRRVGVFTSLGIVLGMTVHIAYSLVGIGYIVAQSIVAFTVLKFIGASYLIYIGCKSFFGKQSIMSQETDAHASAPISAAAAVKIGILTEVTNPKATLFFLALFTQVIDAHTPRLIVMLYGVEMVVVEFIWFGLVALFFSQDIVRAKMHTAQKKIEKVFGAVLIALGIKVALAHRN